MEVLFRGMTPAGRWVYGDLVREGGGTYIVADDIYFSVYPHTVGQYTGATDRDGTKIFEGDILDIYEGDVVRMPWTFAVRWQSNDIANYFEAISISKRKVIGNIHENPEMARYNKPKEFDTVQGENGKIHVTFKKKHD